MDPSYNNSFDSLGTNSGQLNGDIALSSVALAKKKKKVLLISFFVVVVILAVFLVAILLIRNKGDKKVTEAERRYVGLVVAGDEKSDNETVTDLYNNNDVFFLEKYYYGENDDWMDYYNKVYSVLDSIETGNTVADNLKGLQKDFLTLLKADRDLSDERYLKLYEIYKSSGESELYSYIEETFGGFKNSSNGYISEYYLRLNELASNVAEYSLSMRKYEGCDLEAETVDENCIPSDDESLNMDTQWQAILSANSDIDNTIRFALDYYIDSVYHLANPGAVENEKE